MRSTQSSDVIWENHSRISRLTIIFSYWTIAKTSDDLWRDEIKKILNFSSIFQIQRVSNFSSISISDFTTIALSFSISRDTITEIHRRIRRLNYSINSAIEDSISTSISINIETFRNNSIQIFKKLISNSSFRHRIRNLNRSVILETLQKS
jgi:hypothetical protein